MGTGDRVQVEEVASRNGYRVHRGTIAPCPRCRVEQRSRRERRRFPVDLRDGGYAWWCHACQSGGTARDFGEPAPEDVYRKPPTEVTYPDRGDIERLWDSAREPAHVSLKDRGIDVDGLDFLDVARGAPMWRPKWWGWTSWVTVPLHDQNGEMRSLHGRRIENGEMVKRGCLPFGFSCEALMMADPAALEAMRGTPSPVGIVCEGLTDYLRMVTEVRRHNNPHEVAVWGGISGSFRALKPEWAGKWFICTDPDAPGDAYAKQAMRAVLSARRFTGKEDICATLNGGATLKDIMAASRWMTLEESR